MLQQNGNFSMSGGPPNSKTDSTIGSPSVSEIGDILREDNTEQNLIQQGIHNESIIHSDPLQIKIIKTTIGEVLSQLLKVEGNKMIPGYTLEEIISKLHIVETEIEGLLKKKVKYSNCRKSDDFNSEKVSKIAELEKKIQTYQEKLKQVIEKEDQLNDQIRRLNIQISAIKNPNCSKEELEQLSLGTIEQVGVDKEKLLKVATTIPVAEFKQSQGLEYIRKCSPEEQSLIAGQYLNIQDQLKKKGENILIYYTFRNDKLNESCGSQEIHQWVKRLIEEIEPGADCYPVVQCFILNPKENQLSQDYHMDYIQHMRTLFVSMDYLTTLNSTQFFKEPLKKYSKLSLRGGKQYGSDEKEILNRENREFMEVSQMICKPYNILLMKPGTVHRGIANRSGVDRVVFSVCYTNVKGYLSGQPKIATQTQDIE